MHRINYAVLTLLFLLHISAILGVINTSMNSNKTVLNDVVLPGEEQCFVRHHSDPIRFLWSINNNDYSDEAENSSFRNITLNIKASKMSATFCIGLQLFSEGDKFFMSPITENYYMKEPLSNDFTMIEDVRYRLYCYFQRLGTLDYDIPPSTFCQTRNGTSFQEGCSYGYANQKLDSFLARADWKFTLRQPFKQYDASMTDLEIKIPMLLPAKIDVQLHLVFVDMYWRFWIDPFSTYGLVGSSYYIPIISQNLTLANSLKPYWHDECDILTYNSRPQYYYWKMVSLSIGVAEFSIILVMLFIKRNHHMIKSRFVVPYFSCGLYLAQGVASIILNIIYYDPEWDTLMEELVVIAVLSLHFLQVLRYYACRYFYSKHYSKRDSIILKVLLSKFLFLVSIIFVLMCEATIVTFLMTSISYLNLANYVYDSICLIVAVGYISVLGVGLAAHFVSNKNFIQTLKNKRRIARWFFLYDDTFGYNIEFFVQIPPLCFVFLHFTVSQLDVSYLTILVFDHTRPISTMYTNHTIGYILYGVSKILMITGFTFQNLFLIIYTFVKIEQPVIDDYGSQQEEMDLFLSKTFSDGTVCMDIMKQFLAREFRVELLELYIFLSKNPKAGDFELSEKYPNYSTVSGISDTSPSTQYEIITRNLLEAFGRLKQTVVYEEEYLKKNMDEIEFVFNSIT